MKTINEIYNESLEKINKETSITGISKEIQLVATALQNKEISKWSADDLSRALTRIAVLRVNLGQEMADATAYYDISYLNRKIIYANEWSPTKSKLSDKFKPTVQDVDSKIQQKLADQQFEELQNKHFAEKLKILYDSTETLITALQSRLSTIKAERFETKYQ